MKKSLLTLLAILMILSMMAVSVAATTDGGSAAVSSAMGKPGQIAYLTVSLSDYAKATSVGVSVKGMPVLGAEWQKTGTMQEFVLADNIGAWASETATNVNGEFLDLAFKIPEDAKNQEEYAIEVTVQVLNGSTVLGTETVTGKISMFIPAESISLDKTSVELELTSAKTVTLTATVKPADHNETLVWSSDNEKVATVKDGVITAHTAGTANITVTAGNVKAVCAVKVTCKHSNLTNIPAKAPTCTAQGNNAYWRCESCGQYLAADKKTVTTVNDQILAVIAHDYAGHWQSNEIQHWQVCSICGNKEAAVNHDYQWVIDKEATENATGTKHLECACGRKQGGSVTIEKLDHVHVDIRHYEKVAANCSTTGTAEHWTCGDAKCAGKFYADAECKTPLSSITIAVDPTVHTGKTLLEGEVEASCVTEGYTGDTLCEGCRVILEKGRVINKTGHRYVWVIDKYPTEQREGMKHEKCSKCGDERSLNTVIAQLVHDPKLVEAKEATCLEDGVIEHFYCANCGRYYAVENGAIGAEIQKEDTIIPATQHQQEETVSWKYDAEGHWKECSCGEQTEKEAHTLELTGAVEATATAEGYTGDEVCTVCGYVAKQGEVIPCLETEEAPEEVVENKPAVDNGKDSGGIIAIVVAAIVACGGGVALVVWKPWKKK